MLEKTVYIRLRNRVLVRPRERIYIKDIAQIIANEALHEKIDQLQLYQISDQDRNIIIIDAMQVIA
ncbi:MAG TPA: stage V sporulation protein AA, partial [Bacillus sp. (in: firmicutes)]|nr:stage V sporulation protein AA [Bacillus sp. (in: firmicutes)]